jgi:phage shock protein PspC (stress-responsive transcriptional regulator)
MTPPVSRRLTRDTHNKVLGGVCSGIARLLGVSPTVVRWAFVISCVLPGPQFVAYLVLWIFLPPDTRA